MAPKPQGKLELTWTNKHLRLLAHEDGSYQWVAPPDYRVAEVRLLRDAGSTGETHPEKERAKDNLLIRGDALNALTSLIELPEFSRELAGKVKLIYIDPPFNTGEIFEQYEDNLEHSVWLTMMRDRLEQIRKLLSPNGSVWVHCDDAEQAYLKVLMDDIFGRSNFQATIVWQRKYSRDNRKAIGPVHDYILVYAPLGTDWKKIRHRLTRKDQTFRNPDDDPNGPWDTVPLQAQAGHATKSQFYTIITPSGKPVDPPKGRCWTLTEPVFRELVKEGRVYWGPKNESRPRKKVYEDEVKGLVPWTWWTHEEVGHTDESKQEILTMFPDVDPFDTPKPERLMERVIHIATDPEDIVLDCFAGSGTTAAVAQKMGRRWIAVEWSKDTLQTFTGPRLEKVVRGEDPGGVTELHEWKGGGGFRVLDVAPSMFAEDDGTIYLSDWAVGSDLNEATAAQFGFDYEPVAPFAGRKGRSRLAVIDGLVSPDVARLLVGALEDRERLVLCGTAVDPDTREVLRALRAGSTVKKIPASILADYKRSQQWWTTIKEAAGEPAEAPVASEAEAVTA